MVGYISHAYHELLQEELHIEAWANYGNSILALSGKKLDQLKAEAPTKKLADVLAFSPRVAKDAVGSPKMRIWEVSYKGPKVKPIRRQSAFPAWVPPDNSTREPGWGMFEGTANDTNSFGSTWENELPNPKPIQRQFRRKMPNLTGLFVCN